MLPAPASGEPGSSKWITVAVVALLAATVTIYYAPFLNNFFDYDDFRYVENMYKGFLDILLGYNTFRVVSNLSWLPLFQISGFDPAGYNLFSFGMLFLDALVFYFLVRELFSDTLLAGLTVLLFAGGSVGADALLWKCTNSTPICFFFYCLSLLTYLRWRRNGGILQGAFSLIAFSLAILSKEEAASLPAILILMELLFLGERSPVQLARRMLPYCAVIVLYIISNKYFFALVGREPEPSKFFKIRPLHTLLTPWSVFSLPPHGVFNFSDPLLYLIPAAVVASIFLIPRKKELVFSLSWIFLTFVPQSLTTLGQWTPKYLFNSISRYLYLPSAGAALALALVLVGISSRWGRKIGVPVTVAVLALYFSVNYQRVGERGREWGNDAEPVRVFVQEMKRVMPQFPPNSYVAALNAPTGRAYVQQSLRASYGNPEITWIVDPMNYHAKPGENAFLIHCLWQDERTVSIIIDEFDTGMRRLQFRQQPCCCAEKWLRLLPLPGRFPAPLPIATQFCLFP